MDAEARRLAALQALEVLDTGAEAIFDGLARLAAQTFQAPMAAISLIDAQRQWFKASVGLRDSETPREQAFCDHTIRQPGVMLVANAARDPRFSENPLVTGDPHIRFYAGAPLLSPEGERIGSLCVIDSTPRADFNAGQAAQLETMARTVSAALALRRDVAALGKLERELQLAHERLAFLTSHSKDLMLRVDASSIITWASPSATHYGYAAEELVGRRARDLIHPDDRNLLQERQVSRFAVQADPRGPNLEYRVLRKDGTWAWIEENPTVVRDAEGRAVEIINVLRDIGDRKRAEGAAAEIQSGMLQPRASLAALSRQVEVDAILQPARNVGGDLYDAFLLSPDKVGFFVGDVTGKGVPAALFMALSKALAHSLMLRFAEDVALAVQLIEAELSRNNSAAMALSLLAGVLDLRTGELQLCNAGEEDPMVIGADGTVRDLRLEGGPPLCAADAYPYRSETFTLAAGEALVLLTDGVTEAQDPAGGFFSRSRTRDALAGVRPLTATLDALVAAVRAFESGQAASDDLTVMALRVKG